MTSFCADVEDLQRYLEGGLDGLDSELLERHIDECRACERKLEALSGRSSPYSPRPPRVPPAPSIPGFDIQAQLGVGGMGVVYLAYQVKMRRPVALKVILSWTRITNAARDRLKDEAVTAGRLGHANVVQVFDADEHQGVPYLVMEYCTRGSLAKELNGTPLPPRKAAELVQTLARAVHAVHDKGVVHCDLKPANVLLAEDGTVKISDFGLARSCAEPGGSVAAPSGGSPPYMAPEQLAGTPGSLGVWTDVYALGTILYECLTGRPPFKGPTKKETCQMVRTTDPVPPRQLQPQVPRGLEEICLKCLNKDVTRRYATAEQLAEELRRTLAGEPLLYTRRVGRCEFAWKWCQRNKPLTAAGVLALLLLCSAVAVPVVFAINERRHSQTLASELRTSQYQRSVNDLEKGLKLLEQGNSRTGLLTLARALQVAPADAHDLQRVIRTNLTGWAPLAGTLRVAPFDCPGLMTSAALSADGRTLVTGGADGVVRVWDLTAGKELRRIPTTPPLKVLAVALSPNGRTVATGDANGVRLWDAETGKEAKRLAPAPHPVQALAFHPAGTHLLVGSGNGAACLCDLAAGRVTELPLHRKGAEQVRAVAFSPDGARFVTGAFKKVRVWSCGPDEPRLLNENATPKGDVIAAAFSADGTAVMTATADDTLEVWSADGGKRLAPPLWRGELGRVKALARAPGDRQFGIVTGSGYHVATGGHRVARIWDGQFRPAGRPVGPTGATVNAAAFGRDGRTVLIGRGGSGSADEGDALLLDAASSAPQCPPLRHRRAVQVVAFHPDDRTVLTGSPDGTVRLWDAARGKPGHVLELGGEVRTAAFSPCGTWVLTVEMAGDAALWSVAGGKRVHQLTPAGMPVRSAAFSPAGRLLATGHDDGTIRVFDPVSGVQRSSHLAAPAAVRAVAFGPKGTLLAAGCDDGTVFLADVDEAGASAPKSLGAGHGDRVSSVSFNPDGTSLLSASQDGTARIWDTATGKVLRPDLMRRTGMCAAEWSADGRAALTTDNDGSVCVWDAAIAQPLGPPMTHGNLCRVHQALFAPDGRSVLTASSAGHASRWTLPGPLGGEVELIILWVELITGKQLDDCGAYRDLDASDWESRCRRLAELGGLPVADDLLR